jgi:hypothetical protein
MSLLPMLALLLGFILSFKVFQAQTGGNPDICRRDAVNFPRRFNAKLYSTETRGHTTYKESGPIAAYSPLPAGHALLTAGNDAAPMRRVILPKEAPISCNIHTYVQWLSRQRPADINPEDRANLRILRRGGTLLPDDIPQKHTPLPVNGEDAWNLLTNTEHLSQPQYVGYLPWNFTESDEKQRSMLNVNEINPNERLMAWELTHYPTNGSV